MKKIISKLALVSVAMVGLFSSCEIENIKTTFDLAEASYTINVKAYYVLTGEEITSDCVIESPFGSGSSIKVPTTNKGINGQTISIKATFSKSGESDTKSFDVPTINPGGAGTGLVEFYFGSNDDLEYSVVLVDSSNKTDIAELQATHYSHATHADGFIWNYNDTEFILEGEVNYVDWLGSEISNITATKDEDVVNGKAAAYNTTPLTKTPATLDITVSAWAAYRAWATYSITTENYNVIKKNTVMGDEEVIGSFVKTTYSTAAQFEEGACPGHEAHYTHGHGSHDTHGGHNNAGGGIVYGE